MGSVTPSFERARRHAAALAIGLALLVAACGGGAGSSPAASTAASPAASAAAIVRSDLGSVLPSAAPGYRLGLWHYTIAPGAALVPHYHPGWQVARVTAGTLTYSILTGTANVIRASGAAEAHSAGETITLVAGDSVVETEDMHHFGANKGTEPVEIYSSTLFRDGEGPAIPLPSASASANP